MESGDALRELRRESTDSATVFQLFFDSRNLAVMTALRRTQLIRFGAWTGLATLAVLVALVAARTETGVRRIANPDLARAAVRPTRSAKDLAARQPRRSTRRRNSGA